MTYLMDTANEGRRLELKTDALLTVAQLRHVGVQPGDRIADVGCGVGTVSRLMADLTGPLGRVIGIDTSGPRLETARQHPGHVATIEYRQGDAAHLPMADGDVDLVWSRFLFEYLDDPRAALADMVRVVKPGGTVVVSDIDGNCIWHAATAPDLHSRIDEALQTLAGRFHPRIGLDLFGLFADQGLSDIRVDVRPYHVIAGTIDPVREEQWHLKLDGVSRALQRRGWTKGRTAELCRAFMDHLRDPRTFTYSVLITVQGTKPAGQPS